MAIVFYRALLLTADTAAIDALCAALAARGLAPAPLAVTSLKDVEAAEFVRSALARLKPAIVVATTAFAAGGDPGAPTPLDGPEVPVLQAMIATTRRAAWREGARGLGAADLAMHVVLPELDGRVLAGAIAFKDPLPPHDGLAFTALANRPEPDRIAAVADRVAALVRLQAMPARQRRVAILMPDYPAAPGRTGYAVGLDVPASVVALLADLLHGSQAMRSTPRHSASVPHALPRCDLRPARDGVAARLTPMRDLLAADLPAGGSAGQNPRRLGHDPAESDPDRCRMARCCSRASRAVTPSWRSRPIAVREPRAGAPTITIRRCRRASCAGGDSGCGSSTWRRSTPSCTWAPTARWNGCPARLSR